MDEFVANNAANARTCAPSSIPACRPASFQLSRLPCVLSFLANLEKAWESRPCTLLHGDVNPGNIWRRKGGVDEEFVFGDWQLILRGPVAWDFITLLICTKVSRATASARLCCSGSGSGSGSC